MRHLPLLFSLIAATAPLTALCQDATPGILTVEGIGGDVDIKSRNPTLSFSKEVFEGSSRILVDAQVQNGGYSKYPIQFQFFINNRLVSTQIRSQELPGAIGLTLDKDQYPVPYNFTIVASLITPNRTFNTTAYGTVTGTELSARLDCSLLLQTAGEDPVEYAATEVAISQSSNGSATLSFTGSSESNATRTASASLSVTGQTATGTVSYEGSRDTGSGVVSGEVTLTNGNLSAIDVTSEDGAIGLSCS